MSFDSSSESNEDEVRFSKAEKKKVLSQIECTYFSNLIKQKLNKKNFVAEDFTELTHLAL